VVWFDYLDGRSLSKLEIWGVKMIKDCKVGKVDIPAYLRVFLAWGSFLLALDASIAVNRWWVEGGYGAYLQNVVLMFVGFTVFIIFVSGSRVEIIGYVFFCAAVYFICNYEIGGPSKFYLTPLDPIFDIGPAFTQSSDSITYRKGVAIIMSLLAATTLAISKLKPKERNV